jgi:dTDP-4-amino-4,6-dideoxygalactose transaminase
MKERIFLSSPHMGGTEMRYINEALETNWIAPLGANVTGFEEGLESYLSGGHIVALSSGTAALHLSMILAGVKAGDMVFCQDLTFSASANPIAYCGAVPVFIDSERETWNMDPSALQKAIDQYGVPKAIVVVHLYGIPLKMDEIKAVCNQYGIILLEDAAEALGASYKGRKCGTFGNYGILSFNGNKIITTSGGGALVCKRKEDAAHALKLATQAREPYLWYEHKEIGFNYRLSNICAGIGRGQLDILLERVEKKRYIFHFYKKALAGFPLSFPDVPADIRPNHWLSVFLLDRGCGTTPTQIIDALAGENIEARHVWKPMHAQPVFSDAAYVLTEKESVSMDIFLRGVCLPSDTKMTDDELDGVVDVVKGVFNPK